MSTTSAVPTLAPTDETHAGPIVNTTAELTPTDTAPLDTVDAATLDTVDAATLALGTPEELAGPPHLAAPGPAAPAPDPAATTRPVARAERVNSVDVLRGISLMGILVMNITDFAYGYQNYLFPLSTLKPVFSGPHLHLNTTLWVLRWVLAEGKMRGLFSILFGAGVILLTARAESRGAGVRTADIYTRRNMWLLLFGMLHCFFIWNGDILYPYAIAALLFLFPFRNLKVKTLLWTAGSILVVNALLADVGQTIGVVMTYKHGEAAHALQLAHKPLTDDQKKAIDSERKSENDWRYPAKKVQEDIANHHGYAKAFLTDIQHSFKSEAFGAFPLFGGDWLGMMLLGMALFKNGFLTLKRSTKLYALTAAICLGLSWSVTLAGCYIAWKSHFNHVTSMLAMQVPYDVGRVAGALGNAALILLLIRFGAFKWLLARCASVGQMALSNYLLTSITMQTLFIWSPLHWYGYLDYYKVYLVAAGMWTFNLTFSSLWLRNFQFGPFEWCWRSLTYWKRQPMRLEAATPLP